MKNSIKAFHEHELKELQKAVNAIWAEISEEVVKELRLAQVPEICFDNNGDGGVMYTTYTAYFKKMNSNCFTNYIVKTKAEYKIHVDLELLYRRCESVYCAAGKKCGIRRNVIIFSLLHESRHIWQAQGNFYVGCTEKVFNPNLFLGHGERYEEQDANMWAVFQSKTSKQTALFKYLKIAQEHNTKKIMLSDDIKIMDDAVKCLKEALL